MNEIWKPIKGYDGLYEVSNNGRVRSLDRFDSLGRLHKGKRLKPSRTVHGYLFVSLNKMGETKQRYIHDIVAETFIGERPLGLQINHKMEEQNMRLDEYGSLCREWECSVNGNT